MNFLQHLTQTEWLVFTILLAIFAALNLHCYFTRKHIIFLVVGLLCLICTIGGILILTAQPVQ